ncbi:MBL fold metallo-hydrolase [Polymorphospora rubra]|uniref:MBL fold metallo-hydrolase n=1 Tax=Polymorphospora rubra TaxID=338584 RepID=UPI0033D8FD87
MTTTVHVTWWGHSTVWIEDSGVRVLTDPVLGNRVAHLRRMRGPTPLLPGAPDAVIVSHLHADHLDLPSLRRLPPHVTIVVPAGAGTFLRRALGPAAAGRCVELAPGEETTVGALRIRAVPAAHHGGRGPWSRHRALAVGYTVHGAADTWFAGDTGLFDEMSDLGPLDLALIPVGGWGPTLGHGHLDPVTAAEAVRRSAPRHAVPIHFGTFWPVGMARVRPYMFHEPGARFARHAAATAPDTRVTELVPGASLTLDPYP